VTGLNVDADTYEDTDEEDMDEGELCRRASCDEMLGWEDEVVDLDAYRW
jgi:hypothetical protein